MRILSIDPSPTNTAMVLFSTDSQTPEVRIEDTGTYTIVRALSVLDLFWTNRTLGSVDTILIERPPIAPGPQSLASQQTIGAFWAVVWHLERLSLGYQDIGPGTWKKVAKGWKIPLPQELEDIHQRDAYQMGMVYLKRRK